MSHLTGDYCITQNTTWSPQHVLHDKFAPLTVLTQALHLSTTQISNAYHCILSIYLKIELTLEHEEQRRRGASRSLLGRVVPNLLTHSFQRPDQRCCVSKNPAKVLKIKTSAKSRAIRHIEKVLKTKSQNRKKCIEDQGPERKKGVQDKAPERQ